MNKNNKKLNKGFTIVETLIAISIFSVSLVSLIGLLSQGLSNSGYAKNKIIAEYLAQEGVEYVRNMRDYYMLFPNNGNFTDFVSALNSCTSSNTCGIDPNVAPPTIFLCSAHNQCKIYINDTSGYYNTDSVGSSTGFVRTIQMTPINTNEVKISSTVSWVQKSGNFKVSFSENLFNWVE